MLNTARPKDTSGFALGAALGAPGAVVQAKLRSVTSEFLGEIAGSAGSREALKRLTQDISDQKRSAARPVLLRASRAIDAGEYETGRKLALEGLAKDEKNGFGWYLLGMTLEILGDFASSIRAYEAALKLLPNHEELGNDLGRLALRLGMLPQAEKLFRHHLAMKPGLVDVINNLGTCLREMRRYDEAIQLIRPAIMENPTSALLWNTMGAIVGDTGDLKTAVTFLEEAVRLAPDHYRAQHNLANMHQMLGDPTAALSRAEAAIPMAKVPSDRAMMHMVKFNAFAALGRIEEAWREYDIRLDPHFAGATMFAINRPQWTPTADIRGKTLLVMGEQGLGDEILFGTVLPDVVEELGPEGRLILSVEARLVNLFQRAFPQATVVAHRTGMVEGRIRRLPMLDSLKDVDLWVPMASLLQRYRTTPESFDRAAAFMSPDPELLDHWRGVLGKLPKRPKIGLLWKSGVVAGARHRYFSPLERWRPVLTAPDVTFVNLQYGDCEDDLAFIKNEMGVEVWQPQDIDLKMDLDGVAALSCACDLVIGFSNATLNIAAAAGANTWLIAHRAAWPLMGRVDRYPWYAGCRLFVPDEFGEWDKPMNEVRHALEAFAAERQAA